MIATLKGRLEETGEDWAIIDVGGVGYLVFCSARTLAEMPAAGSAVKLRIETHVREDHIHLFGFLRLVERDWFRELITVQGVGTRVALAILSVLAPGELARALAAGDRAALARASGVGPKLAQRIVTELRDRAGAMATRPVAANEGISGPDAGQGAPAAGASAMSDAVSALVNLGYGRSEAFGAVTEAARDLADGEGASDAVSVENLIHAGLRRLGAVA